MSKEFNNLAAKKGHLIYVDPEAIKVSKGFNHRDFSSPQNSDHVAALAESIAQRGVETPLKIRIVDGEALLVDGECRLRAVRQLNKKGTTIASVPCIEFTGDDAEALSASLAANGGKPPAQWEVGAGYKRLVDKFGWTPEKIAEDQGVSLSWVKKAIDLAGADPAVKSLLASQAVTAPFVVAKIRKHGGQATALIIQAVQSATATKSKGGEVDSEDPLGTGGTSGEGGGATPKKLKREKKSSGYYFLPESLDIIGKALRAGEAKDDAKLSALCETALAEIESVKDKKDKKPDATAKKPAGPKKDKKKDKKKKKDKADDASGDSGDSGDTDPLS